jgi:peptidoglycan-associated lipoprotein
LLAACLVACGGEAQETLRPAAGPPPAAQAGTYERVIGWPDLGQGSARYIRIDLGPDAFAECRRVSPTFPFDSDVAYAQDRIQIAALAACLNASSMRDRKVQLVGRADPEGSDAYNEELGMKRARAIKQILIENGITQDRIELASEGSKGAMSNRAEYSAGHDRRVDVVITGASHVPYK